MAEDAEDTLAARGDGFTRVENGRQSTFAWTPIENLASMNFYPSFLKKEIFRLPEQIQLRTSVD